MWDVYIPADLLCFFVIVSSLAAEEETARKAYRDAPHALAIVTKFFPTTARPVVRKNTSFRKTLKTQIKPI
ncbi:hypothetical protein [Undibacterium rugosum]|uniref:hypothetical protein n=1 Tax=Undibacterium rugosum TaxID=2762291 RepID=UPI001B81C208|nr:hypothetical protein [Undibacterium rugosum]MBR7776976.1 hypothetical protein [Undibacterium rugosum]